MTTLVEARAELIAALHTAGAAADAAPMTEPPYIYVTREGADTTRLAAGLVAADYRLVCVGGAFDTAAAARELDTLVQLALVTVRALDGWRVGEVGRDQSRDWQGGTYLTADVGAARIVNV